MRTLIIRMHVLARSDLQVVRHVGQKLNAVRRWYASLFATVVRVRRDFENIRINAHILRCVLLFPLILLPLIRIFFFFKTL